MRVLFCQTVPYPPESAGGAESTVHALCRGFRARGVAVEVLAGLRRDAPLLQRVRAAFPRGPHGIHTDRRFGYPVHRSRDPLAALAPLCRGGERPVVVAQAGAVFALCRRAAELGLPALAYLQDTGACESEQAPPRGPGITFATTSAFMRERLRARLGLDADAVPPLVDPDSYRTATTREVVTFVNPIPRKGVEIAFELAARRPDIPFEFVESWALRRRVARLVEARAAHHGNVRFRRRVADMRPIYARSRIVLVPSLCEEAWGRVVTEAQISGIPAIATAAGALPEAVGDGGLLLDRAAPAAEWEAALARLWDDPAAYEAYSRAALTSAARPEIRSETLIDRWLDLLKGLEADAAGSAAWAARR